MKLGRLFGRSDQPESEDDEAEAPDDIDVATAPPDGDDEMGDGEGDSAGERERGDADDDGDDRDVDQEDEADEEDEPQQVVFELTDWGARERKLLDNELIVHEIRYAWEAGDLVVAGDDGDDAQELIDLIQQRTALDLSSDAEPVIYDIGDWPPGLEDRFIEALIEATIAHARGYQEITVGIDDEEKVDAIVEEISRQWEEEQPTDEELEGPDAQQVLSSLFLSADRLVHGPKSRAGAETFADAARDANELGLPFGFEQGDWDALLESVEALGEVLSEEDASEDDILEAATELRSRLRPVV